jgi:hypothetical protein
VVKRCKCQQEHLLFFRRGADGFVDDIPGAIEAVYREIFVGGGKVERWFVTHKVFSNRRVCCVPILTAKRSSCNSIHWVIGACKVGGVFILF